MLSSDLSSSLMLFDDEGDSAPDSGRVEFEERCFKRAEAATAAAAALASALMAKGDLICKGYCGSEMEGAVKCGEDAIEE